MNTQKRPKNDIGFLVFFSGLIPDTSNCAKNLMCQCFFDFNASKNYRSSSCRG